MRFWAIASLFFILNICRLEAQAPSAAHVEVGTIFVEGNKKTKTSFILRELYIQPGDSILVSELANELERNRLQLMNTGLFTKAEINIGDWEVDIRRLDLRVKVAEAWYIYPIPIFELADRNFNTWWKDYDHSLRRINYGLSFYHNNLTGRKDVLKGKLQFGFTNKYELIYSLPYVDRRQKLGLSLGATYSRNKEVNYNTFSNHQQFFRSSDHYLLNQFRVGVAATLRRKRQVYHIWEMIYHLNTIDSKVRNDLNFDYFLGRLEQSYTSLSYELIADTRDIRPYPLHGAYLEARLQKDGLGNWEDINSFYLSALGKQYLFFSRRWSMELVGAGRLAIFRQKQPYANSRALGYDEHYIRGYELYVIDGLDYVYAKKSLRFQLLDKTIYWGLLMPFESMQNMSYRLYLSLNNDVGFANNPYYAGGNSLANNFLWGYGLGLDLIVYYNKVFRVEFSRNRLGENGVFLHWSVSL